MAKIEESSFAEAAKIMAVVSSLGEQLGLSSEKEAYIKQSILNMLSAENKNPAQLEKMLTLLAGIQSLSHPVQDLDGLMQKLEKLCAAEKKVRISPRDARLIENANKIKACVNSKLTELQSENSQQLTANRINLNHCTNAKKNVDAFTKAIFLQGVL
ncbi:MAG: hypothetical protein ACRDDW_00355 [Candidatus Rhabdochlamydia sp.]